MVRVRLFTLVAMVLVAANVSAQQTTPKEPPPQKEEGILVFFPPGDYGDFKVVVEGKGAGKASQIYPKPVFVTPTAVGAIVDPDKLAKSFRDLMQKLGSAFIVGAPALPGGYEIDQIELQLQITAEGSVGIIASGKAGMTGGISVVLKRPAKP